MTRISLFLLSIPAAALCFAFGQPTSFYERHDLLSDGSLPTANVNPGLVNPWGLAASPTSPFWIANEGSGTTSIVSGNGSAVLNDIGLPSDHSAHPTGVVFNGGQGFLLSPATQSSPARFLFATLDGRILGWNPAVDAGNAVVVVDNGANGAVYTGLAKSRHGTGEFLYAANFASGSVDVFDRTFAPVASSFVDPNVPAGWGPFGIAQAIDRIYVTFVPRDPVTGEEQTGPGNGLIDEFTLDGALIRRMTTGGELNAPWGLLVAPTGFGPFSQDLLVGNFGDGRILAFDRTTGAFQGQLEDQNGQAIVIEGVWGLLFGNGAQGTDTHDLYFTAGIDDETHGVFGEIEFVP